MKKIAFIFRQYASYPGLPGGTRHYEIAKELYKYDFDVYIFVTSFNHMYKKDVKTVTGNYTLEKIDNVNFIWVKSFPYYKNNWRRLVNILSYGINSYIAAAHIVKKETGTVDYSIGSIAHIFSVLSAYFISRNHSAEYVIDIGDLWPEVFVFNGTLKKKSVTYFLMKKVMHFFYNKAKLIICLTKPAMNYFVTHGYENKTLIVSPSLSIKGKKNICISKEKKYFDIMYIGSFQKIYCLENIIKAASILEDRFKGNNVRFILIGDGDTKASLSRKVLELGLKNIIFEKAIPKKDVLSKLEAASAYLLIEKGADFGFPNKLLEYTKSAKPILYASPTRHELLHWNCCLEAKYDNPMSIAEASFKLSKLSYEKLMHMSSNSRRYFEENHNIEKNVNKLFNRLMA